MPTEPMFIGRNWENNKMTEGQSANIQHSLPVGAARRSKLSSRSGHLPARESISSLRQALLEAHIMLREKNALLRKYDNLRRLMDSGEEASHLLEHLTSRQYEIMTLVLSGTPSKTIAADLQISQRTVENHRAAVMKKTGSNCLAALGRIGFAARLYRTGENSC